MNAPELAETLESMVMDADVPLRWKPALIRAARRLRVMEGAWEAALLEATRQKGRADALEEIRSATPNGDVEHATEPRPKCRNCGGEMSDPNSIRLGVCLWCRPWPGECPNCGGGYTHPCECPPADTSTPEPAHD